MNSSDDLSWTKKTPSRKEFVVLVEGPAWGDAEFYGRWLLSAAKANKLLGQARKYDLRFRKTIKTLEIMYFIDFGIAASVFISFFDSQHQYQSLIVVESETENFQDFVLMVEKGFFVLTGDRYQITLLLRLDIRKVKASHLKLAATVDED